MKEAEASKRKHSGAGEDFAAAIADLPLISRVYFFPEIDSTSTWAHQLLLKSGYSAALHGSIVLADYQTAGRGRYQRAWVSPPQRSLLFTLILSANAFPFKAQRSLATRSQHVAQWLSLAAPLSVCEGLQEAAQIPARVKYPNDVYVHDSKIAGILLENSGSEHEWFLVGIGVNVNQTRDELPSPAECQATSLFCETQRQFERPRVLRAILEKLSRWWELGDIAPLTRRMNELCYTIGRLVKIVLPETEIMGVALGIAPGGALLVRDSAGRTREVYAGDIRELRFIEPKP